MNNELIFLIIYLVIALGVSFYILRSQWVLNDKLNSFYSLFQNKFKQVENTFEKQEEKINRLEISIKEKDKEINELKQKITKIQKGMTALEKRFTKMIEKHQCCGRKKN